MVRTCEFQDVRDNLPDLGNLALGIISRRRQEACTD
jgi:hypothetical protein